MSLSTVYKAKEKNLQKKNFLRKSGCKRLNKKRNKGFLTALATAMKKDPTTSIRKHASELKVHEKTVRTAIKEDLSPDFNPLDEAYQKIKQMQLPIQILDHLRTK